MKERTKWQRICCGIWAGFAGVGVVCVVMTVCAVFCFMWQDMRKTGDPGKNSKATHWRSVNGQEGSDEVQAWLKEEDWKSQVSSQLGIVTPRSRELFEVNLTDADSPGLCFERMFGELLQVAGRRDAARGYFDGSVGWQGQEICIVNFATMEYAVLKENIKSIMLGDYYISCGYDEKNRELELLIFYCPA